MRLECKHREAEEVHTPSHLYAAAWEECLESQVMDKSAWIEHAVSIVQGIPRYELFAYDGERVVGGVVLAGDCSDPHVGTCLTVVYNYVLPEYRNRGLGSAFIRAAITLARECGIPVLAYTHRVGVGKYTTTYRRVHGKGNHGIVAWWRR